jgi:hypothetical protein
LKTHHGFERMRLRGLYGAHEEFYLAAIVHNFKRSQTISGAHRQPIQPLLRLSHFYRANVVRTVQILSGTITP